LVHGLPSSQLVGVPGWHEPPLQTSPVVQAFPSLHGAVLFVWTQPPSCGLQLSSVHGLLSSQLTGVPAQTPLEQTSPVVHGLPSLHAFVFD
jgi:hypothetical protein